jgi:hypothetical protein
MAKTFYFFNIEREICVPVENCTDEPTLVTKTFKSPGESKTPSTSVEVPLPGMPLSGTAFTSAPPSQPAKLRIGGKLGSLEVVSTGIVAVPQSMTTTITPTVSVDSDDAALTQAPRQFDQLANFWEVTITTDGSITKVDGLPYPMLEGWSTSPPSFAKDLYTA